MLVVLWIFASALHLCGSNSPIVINTWHFTAATEEAWKAILETNALDAIEAGCSTCERLQCDGTVGFGGSPDENGETLLDAMIMDGRDMNVGAVLSMRRVKNAIAVARRVLDHTQHSILAGDLATRFAIQMGFVEESLSTPASTDIFDKWKANKCQPNYWLRVSPDPTTACGPYKPINSASVAHKNIVHVSENNHDTIGMVAVDAMGNIAAGTSTNGLRHKIPGRVGDSAIPGSGAYADNEVGGAAATGDGDVLLRFLPSFLAVENMRRGMDPTVATQEVMSRIARVYPKFMGGIVAVNALGQYGAACNGMAEFPFSVAKEGGDVIKEKVPCIVHNVVLV